MKKLKLKKGRKIFIDGVTEVEVLWFDDNLVQVLYENNTSGTLIRKNHALSNERIDNINVEPVVKVGLWNRLKYKLQLWANDCDGMCDHCNVDLKEFCDSNKKVTLTFNGSTREELGCIEDGKFIETK